MEKFDIKEAGRVKEIEKITNHDVKAIEYYVREKLEQVGLEKFSSYVHFACTSEDINNLAYSLMLTDCLNKVIYPNIDELIANVSSKADELTVLIAQAKEVIRNNYPDKN